MSSMASGHAIPESFDIAPTANSPRHMSNHTEAACSALIEAIYPLLRLRLLLLGDLLAGFRRLIDQGGSVIIFLALSDKGQPSAGHIEKGAFALGVGSLLGKPNTLSRVRPIFSSF
jgi:hypothetical protein